MGFGLDDIKKTLDKVDDKIPDSVKDEAKKLASKDNLEKVKDKAGDVIELSEKAKSLQRYKDVVEVTGGRLYPEWLDTDLEAMKATIKSLPTREQIDVPVNEMLIVELYSK